MIYPHLIAISENLSQTAIFDGDKLQFTPLAKNVFRYLLEDVCMSLYVCMFKNIFHKNTVTEL